MFVVAKRVVVVSIILCLSHMQQECLDDKCTTENHPCTLYLLQASATNESGLFLLSVLCKQLRSG